ncbi:D-alanyl-D-alanine carboxypeptidase [Gilvimarinus agarilyticus]|uniref:D-alanyl-D-alanine carboxypeptidase family protein n=1 Tax=unclassified Gilvimarinus TaxID=2642066 RepID=UPI001C0910F9|nr:MULTISPECIES: D-alanyl-D-alanine carboxypeptidase family protein [unclassified Gilvimarinus]MBU2887612.1 D-alanyl-D-alanine carboxypeptidase [Gilvimarinus agarilyticus]MDO6572263.1 D-alanyl-D-alanine carboxypeptidase family protein [Gilvimarinus sp. 2_MG-2023]MDO6746830.1 D-alanyl-D-alanine carboxypeptidase family protein [Gilvimarinus sp. 1_MG-2023]
MLSKILSFAGIFTLSVVAHAQQVLIPAPPQLAATGYLLLDADTGEVLVEHNADEQLPPASLTKMMTSYIVTNELEHGRLGEQDLVNVSVKAWKMGGSKMFVREGTQVPVMDLLRGVIIQSGNDASVALAEHIAGGEDAFADVMNQSARLLGMNNTHFVNSTGWPAEGHLTTARDLALLAKAIIEDHPQYYPLYAEKYFEYNEINQPNRNRLLFRDATVDGLKTGHTEAAGYCLVASAKRNNMRLISVVMGTKTESSRAAETQKLLAYGFRYFENATLYSAGAELESAPVWYGKSDRVALSVDEDVIMTIPRGSRDNIEANLTVAETLKAPIAKGDELGQLILTLNGETLATLPVVASHEVEQAGLFARLIDAIKLFIASLLS